MTREIVLILNDIRSCYNVGSIMRTADASGIKDIICSGITPYPRIQNDTRIEKIIENNTKMIHKTALDAENSLNISHFDSVVECVRHYKDLGYQIIALENKVDHTQDLFAFTPSSKIALILGSETSGIEQNILELCDVTLEIPMRGIKNSLNVSVAAGIALYRLSK